MKLSLALSMLDAALAEARRLEVSVCVSIVDAAAWPVVFARMDAAPLGVVDVSQKKARTAALFQMDSADFAAKGRPDGEAYTLENTNGGLTSFGGGLVIKAADGSFLGAIGVSGAKTEDDIAIARVAMKQAVKN
ncbi:MULTISPECIES: heme-binding protein [Acetobacter]|nr:MULTISPECIES: heme-binding protein [Acetobacter]ATI12769.1 heme-binding protein [Acetobacter pomorum]AXC27100.1 heme-binding protein [Acetobacter sp. JWB]KAA8428870.1 heme-binding protein [Acetobacter pomorum]KAA8432060.1 heme-binding protein [Acetobacter pomorum]KAA8453833.1 heme-binding protein [Acetobacter pomorum]